MKCQHGREKFWCVKCRYGNTGKHDESFDDENPKDLVDELKKTTNYRKIKEVYDDE